MTTDEYLSHCYTIPEPPPVIPLADETFTSLWQEARGKTVWEFLKKITGSNVTGYSLQDEKSLQLFFAKTLGGRLPVIVTGDRNDFCSVEAILNSRSKAANFPVTVNAFTMQTRAKNIRGHRVILLGQAPYSNVPAQLLGLEEEDWLKRSFRLRLAHECAHYETLRLFGNMQNHALDEIVADALGQIAAFGNFSAERQRLFFGLEKGTGRCNGRLSFYCRDLLPWDRSIIYRSVDAALDLLEEQIDCFMKEKSRTNEKSRQPIPAETVLSDKTVKYELLSALAGTSIAARISQ